VSSQLFDENWPLVQKLAAFDSPQRHEGHEEIFQEKLAQELSQNLELSLHHIGFSSALFASLR
jgi:hypothetical protein